MKQGSIHVQVDNEDGQISLVITEEDGNTVYFDLCTDAVFALGDQLLDALNYQERMNENKFDARPNCIGVGEA